MNTFVLLYGPNLARGNDISLFQSNEKENIFIIDFNLIKFSL